MRNKYAISLALGWALGGVFIAAVVGFGQWGEMWVAPVAFVLTFAVTMTALQVLE